MLADRYTEALREIPGLEPPFVPRLDRPELPVLPGPGHADYPLSRDELMQALLERGISTRRGIMNAHQEPAYAGHAAAGSASLGGRPGRGLLLPLYDGLSEDDQDYVIDCLRELASRAAIGASMTRPLVILGTGGRAYDLLDIVEAINAVTPTWEIVGFLDDAKPPGQPSPRVRGPGAAGRCSAVSESARSSTRSAATAASAIAPGDPGGDRPGGGAVRDAGAPGRLGLAACPTRVVV